MTKHSSLNYTPQETRWLTAIVGLTFLASLLSIAVVATLDIADELREEAEEIVTRVELIGRDSLVESNRLDAIDTEKCSAAHIAAMRGSLHRHFFIQSIRYQDDTVQCQVGDHADYDEQIVLADGSAVKGMFNVVNQPSRTIVGLEAQVGNYIITYPNKLPETFMLFDAEYEVSFQQKQTDTYIHWMGNDNLHQRLQLGFNHWSPEFALIVEDCGEQYRFCASLGYSLGQFIDAFIEWLGIIIIASVGIALFVFYRVKTLYRRRRTIHHRVETGVRGNDYFYCEYQPIVDLDSKQIIGCEVLARFTDQYGSITPDQFIPVIAELKQSIPFTRHIIANAINEIKSIPVLPNGFKLNVNLFPEDLAQESMWQFISMQSKRDPRLHLTIEITEDQQIDLSQSERFTLAAQQQGIQIAIDDFGTGYANLANLQQLHCDILKIDRSFVNGLQHDSILSSLLPNIVEIANKLEMTIVAEGIETETQYKALRKLGISQGQGWLFGRPTSASQLAAALNAAQSLTATKSVVNR